MPKNDKFVKALGKHIDKIRREKGLSYQEMALACDMDKGQIYDLASTGTDLRASTLLKIAKGLEIPIAELFDFPH
jgi:transcriptional regulator with XRE-family HTH domain